MNPPYNLGQAQLEHLSGLLLLDLKPFVTLDQFSLKVFGEFMEFKCSRS